MMMIGVDVVVVELIVIHNKDIIHIIRTQPAGKLITYFTVSKLREN